MRLQLTDSLREQLWRVRAEQLQDLRRWAAAEDLLVAREVVAVHDGPGGTSFIGLDGRVIHWNSREPGAAEEITDVQLAARVVAEFSILFDIPEMLELLPRMPPRGQVCRKCGGSRLMPNANPSEYQGICTLCYGLGWIEAE
jgi:hypothetical protein